MYYKNLDTSSFDESRNNLIHRYEDQRNSYFSKGVNNFGDQFNPIDTGHLDGGIGHLSWLNPVRLISFAVVGIIIFIIIRKLGRK